METITFTMNSESLTVPSGTTIMQAADQYRIPIPRLCDHQSLKPTGACRICIVEDMKTGRVISSCTTPAGPGMVISTDSDRIRSHRRNIIRLIMAEHPESCLVCGKGNRCELRAVAAELNVGVTGLNPMQKFRKTEIVNPFIVRDLTKCIVCGRCIRACRELVGAGVIDYQDRGFDARPATVHDTSYIDSSCIFCGTCQGICPTGALLPAFGNHVASPEQDHPSVCGFCSAGCRISVGSAASAFTGIEPAHEPGTINGSTLCVRGHYANDFVLSPNRLDAPMIRKNGSLEKVSWDEAVEYTADRLMEIKKTNGPEAMGFFGSSKCTCEENYLFRKLSAACFGSNNHDNGSSVRDQGFLPALLAPGRNRFRACRVSDIESARTILVFGSDVEFTVPMIDFAVKRALAAGARLIHFGTDAVFYPSQNAVSHTLKQGSELSVLTGIARAMVTDSNVPPDTAATENARAFIKQLKRIDPVSIESAAGLGTEIFRSTAQAIQARPCAIVAGSQFICHPQGQAIAGMVINLSTLAGSAPGYPSDCFYALMENNCLGSRFMGAGPRSLPGNRGLDAPAIHSWEALWETTLPGTPGLDFFQMLEKAEKGKLASLYIMGENPARSLESRPGLIQALAGIEFVVVQDILENETSMLADVILPGAAPFEKNGSFINLEGQLRFFNRIFPPPGNARPDLEILSLIESRCRGRQSGRLDDSGLAREISSGIPAYTPGKETAVFPGSRDAPADFIILTDLEKELSLTGIRSVDARPSRYHLGCGTRTGNSKKIRRFEEMMIPDPSGHPSRQTQTADHD